MEKAETKGGGRRFSQLLHHLPGGALIFAVVPLIVLGYLGWFYYGAEHLDQALYALRQEKMVVTPQPIWIRSNIREDVFSNGRLDRISLLDPRATATIAQAFETHNWVRSATRVTKSSGGEVVVDLVYRRPVAMVYFEKPLPEGAPPGEVPEPGFFPVDESGVLLPTHDFSTDDVTNYFMIFAEGARPAGDVGMSYGDVRVSEALKLCVFLENYREKLQLQEIWVSQDPVSAGEQPWSMTLVTSDNREIIWGHVPHAEQNSELPAEEKLNRLVGWLQTPADPSRPETMKLDLRTANSSVTSTAHQATLRL